MTSASPDPDQTQQQGWQVQRIVVPTDFSEAATKALDVALLLAKQLGASLDLVHVDQTPPPVPPGAALEIPASTLPTPSVEPQRAAVRARLQGIAKQCNELAVATGALVVPTEGNEARAIIKAAMDRNADLIVMGTHGRSGLARLMLGSVTESVLRHTSIPLLAVPAPVSTEE